jgi:hypothetical protein
MTEQEIYEAFYLMERMGGGFAHKIASAWFWADQGNRARIEKAFADMIKKFHDIAQSQKGEQA